VNSVAEAALSSWAFEPGVAALLLASALIYLRGWSRLRLQAPARFPTWRMWCFLGGLATVYIALASPLDAFASMLLIVHMIQHLLLTMVAPPLLLLGCPQLPLLCGLPKSVTRDALGPFLKWPSLRNAGHFFLHPVFCLVAFVVSNVAWHTPVLYELALHSPAWHKVEHACFLTTSILFWWFIIQPWPSHPRWPRLAAIPVLLLADLQNTALSAFLSFSDQPLYPTYQNAPRLMGFTPVQDQAAAGALMWVPGSIVFLFPIAAVTISYLSRKRSAPAPTPRPAKAVPIRREPFDLWRAPVIGHVMRAKYFRPTIQIILLLLAAAIVLDGFLGPKFSPMNLAGVLPWTHWRAFTVVALLIAGNFFCMACPFMFVRDLGRKLLPARGIWPRALRSKWLAVALLGIYLWAYEAFSLWDHPAVTAAIILGYFLAALLIDGFFKGASFCKFVCPIGQFHFVQSLVSPLEIKIRRPDVCASCKTFDCIKGNETQRGCELQLFQPRKVGNIDCTFCLDCVKACPHDNVGIMPSSPLPAFVSPAPRFAKRLDLAALVLVLTFGAFANAAGMVTPVTNAITNFCAKFGLPNGPEILAVLALLSLGIVPTLLSSAAAAITARVIQKSFRETFCRFSIALAPLGFGMWLAHFVFHFFTGALTPIPVFQRVLHDLGLSAFVPQWNVPSFAFYNLPALELLFLDLGLLASLFFAWRIAAKLAPKKTFAAFFPWGVLAVLLYAAGVWIVFQPMQMRGTMLS